MPGMLSILLVLLKPQRFAPRAHVLCGEFVNPRLPQRLRRVKKRIPHGDGGF